MHRPETALHRRRSECCCCTFIHLHAGVEASAEALKLRGMQLLKASHVLRPPAQLGKDHCSTLAAAWLQQSEQLPEFQFV